MASYGPFIDDLPMKNGDLSWLLMKKPPPNGALDRRGFPTKHVGS